MAHSHPLVPSTDRLQKFISHCNKGLNAKFTLLNNTAWNPFLRNRINCAAIVGS
jgi:hypothetical protein